MNAKHLFAFLIVTLAVTVTVLVAEAQGPRGGSRAPAAAVGTGFTYQGQLKQNGALVTNSCDFQFGLWDALAAGPQYGATQTVSSLVVASGLFSTTLDFGAGATNYFTGTARYLAIAVRCPAGSGVYTALNPRETLTPAPYAFALPGLYTQPNSTSPNVIGGYSGNFISSTVVAATISGGGASANANIVTADYGTIGGGKGNIVSTEDATIGGGRLNNASGIGAATIAGGVGNTASGSVATVGGGTSNFASGERAAIAGGFANTASGAFSSVPGGYYTSASHYGEMAYASGFFFPGASGNAQTSTYVLRNTTADATPTELFLDGSAVRLTIPISRVVTFDILVVGVNISGGSAGNSAGYRLAGAIKNIGGATTFIGTPNQTVFGEDNASWDATVVADNTNDALVVQVTGAGTANIRWVASVRTVEVAY